MQEPGAMTDSEDVGTRAWRKSLAPRMMKFSKALEFYMLESASTEEVSSLMCNE